MNKFIKQCSVNKISLANVSKQFVEGDNHVCVVENISYEFIKGRTYALMGSSGTGKSTVLHIIAGFEQPTTGAVLYDSVDRATCTKKQQQEFLLYAFGILLQNAYLLDELSVIENIMLKGLSYGLSKQDCLIEAQTLLESVGLIDKIDALPTQLSGGQQQRVALARALFGQPDFIVADEPTGNLDEATTARVLDTLIDNQQRYGMGVIISTHDKAVAARMDTVLIIKDGTLQEM